MRAKDLTIRPEQSILTLVTTEERHHISFGTNRRGGRTWGHQGGHYRESTVSCSCGWGQSYNGQSYAESVQAGRDHLKDVGVYTTPLEQTVYAHLPRPDQIDAYVTAAVVAEKSGRTLGRVQKALDKLVERGNVVKQSNGNGYWQTDKWFSWND